MRAAKWGLSAVLGALSMMSVGVGSAWSDTFVVVCNRTPVNVWFAVTAHPATGDSRYLIAGFFEVAPRTCRDLYSVGNGWAYFYAETSDGNSYWGGSDQRFCVNYPGPFLRYISDAYNCSGPFLKSFQGLYAGGGTLTVTVQ